MSEGSVIESLIQLLSKKRLQLHNEKVLQGEIEELLKENRIEYSREHHLAKESIIDFLIADVGVEVKIAGNPRDIYRQVQRYLDFEEINAIIVVTSKSIRFPGAVKGKPVYIFNLNRAWL